MNTLILVFALFFAVALATPETEYQSAFTQWMHLNKKNYQADEFQAKYATFKANYDFVHSWDAEAKGFEVELNFLADLTLEEYKNIYLGTKVNIADYKLIDDDIVDEDKKGSSVDWRTKGYVTPIKNQGQCGSCYTFSAVASTEGAVFKSTKKLISLSEQQLVDCSTAQGNQGCQGGLMDNCFTYIESNGGIQSEDAYPYTAQQGMCKQGTSVAKISSHKDVTAGSETALAAAIKSVGPISVAIDASHQSFQLYKSGTYYESACSSSQLDHGVTAVGYTSAAYIVKNSWGTSWGNQGYIDMARGKSNNCGIASDASYPIA